jgi:epoxyqueuosine reductase
MNKKAGQNTMKDKIRKFVLDQGIDDVGFAAVSDYKSPQSPPIETLFPEAKSIVVACVKEMSHVDSPNPQIAMNGRLDIQEYARSTNYKIARFLEKECGARAMSVPLSYPLELSPQNPRSVADVSLRHAAVAAGLGVFGRHNLVINPRLGPRVLFMAVLTDLAIPSDQPVTEELCTRCNICVESCPASALNFEGQTDFGKCLMVSQPYGLAKIIGFWMQWADKSPAEQKKMLFTKDFFMTYQASFIGFQYFCFKCYNSCPVGSSCK